MEVIGNLHTYIDTEISPCLSVEEIEKMNMFRTYLDPNSWLSSFTRMWLSQITDGKELLNLALMQCGIDIGKLNQNQVEKLIFFIQEIRNVF